MIMLSYRLKYLLGFVLCMLLFSTCVPANEYDPYLPLKYKYGVSDDDWKKMNKKGKKQLAALFVMDKTDEIFPPLKFDKESSELITSIDSTGKIQLQSGVELWLAGVDCSPSMIDFMKIYIGEKVAYIVISEEKGVMNAYVWAVSFGVQAINENGLVNNWCEPVPQKNHTQHERYKFIKKMMPFLMGNKTK